MDFSDITDSEPETPRTRRRLIPSDDDDGLEDVEMLHGAAASPSGRDNRLLNARRNGSSNTGATTTTGGSTTTNQRSSTGFHSAFDMLRSEAHGSTTTTDVGSSTRARATRPSTANAVAAVSETEDEEIEQGPTFKPETLHAIFKQVWSDPGTKAGKESLQLSAEYLRLFTIEALHRATLLQREGEDEDLREEKTVLELDSLESIVPQLVLDF